MKKYILVFFLVAVIMYMVLINIQNSILTPSGKSVTEEQFINDVYKIIHQENLTGSCTLISEKSELFRSISDWKLAHNEKGVSISLFNQLFRSVPKTFNEVKVTVKIWRYAQTHEMPFNLYGTFLEFGKYLQGTSILTLTHEEYERFYKENITEDMSEKEIIEKLTDVIIKENGYERNTV